MIESRRLHPRWPGAMVAVACMVGFAGVAPAEPDVTATFASGTIEDADGVVFPGVTISVKSL